MTLAIGEGMSAADAMVAAMPRLRRYALKLTRNADAANDLVQDTLVKGLTKQHLFQPDASMATWLGTMMHHQYVDQVRKWARDLATLSLDDKLPPVGIAPAQDNRGLLARDINRALAKLPEQRRQAVVLVGANGMTYGGAAEVMGIPEPTIKSHIKRGRAALRQLMDGEYTNG